MYLNLKPHIKIIYRIWYFFYNLLNFFNYLFDRWYWYFNPEHVTRLCFFSDFAHYYKLLFIYFYEYGSLRRLSYIYSDMHRIMYVRAVRYPFSHLLFTLCNYHELRVKRPTYCSYRIYRTMLKIKQPRCNIDFNKFNRITMLISYKFYILYETYKSSSYHHGMHKSDLNMFNAYSNILKLLRKKKVFSLLNPNTVSGFKKLFGKKNTYIIFKKYFKFKKKMLFQGRIHQKKKIFLKINKKNFSKIVKSYSRKYAEFIRVEDFKVFALYYTVSKLNSMKKQFNYVDSFTKLLLMGAFPLHFRPTDASIYNSYEGFSEKKILFLRKNKIFNKGRYSRNRQLYRTGVYWCIWVNIIVVFGLYFYFYRFTFNFGYIWWPLGIFIFSIFGNRLFKYRFYNFFNIFNEILCMQPILASFFIHLKKQFIPAAWQFTVWLFFFLISLPKRIYNWYFS